MTHCAWGSSETHGSYFCTIGPGFAEGLQMFWLCQVGISTIRKDTFSIGVMPIVSTASLAMLGMASAIKNVLRDALLSHELLFPVINRVSALM